MHDERRVQDAVLALMHLNAHTDKFGWRAWKTFPWEATDGLFERGLIDDAETGRASPSVVSVSFTVQWTQTAVDDLLSMSDYAGDRDGAEAAERLYGQITPVVAGLETIPFRYRVVPELEAQGIDGYRELLVDPYRLAFAVRGGDVVLLTVLDGRRDLGELLIDRALRERD